MLLETETRSEPRKWREVRFPGICAAAEKLGVNRTHLYLVLAGKRESKSLTSRYLKLQAKRKETE